MYRLVGRHAHLDDGGDVRVVHAARGDVRREHDEVGTELVGDARALRLRATRVHLKDICPELNESLAVELREARSHKEDDDLVGWRGRRLTQQAR